MIKNIFDNLDEKENIGLILYHNKENKKIQKYAHLTEDNLNEIKNIIENYIIDSIDKIKNGDIPEPFKIPEENIRKNTYGMEYDSYHPLNEYYKNLNLKLKEKYNIVLNCSVLNFFSIESYEINDNVPPILLEGQPEE